MKALTYLQYFCLGWEARQEYEINLLASRLMEELDNEMNLFYSQQFKPELITKLFEGWELFTDNEYFSEYICNDKYSFNYDYRGNITYYVDSQRVLSCYYPETLDNFIRDCQRAAIELTFKEKL